MRKYSVILLTCILSSLCVCSFGQNDSSFYFQKLEFRAGLNNSSYFMKEINTIHYNELNSGIGLLIETGYLLSLGNFKMRISGAFDYYTGHLIVKDNGFWPSRKINIYLKQTNLNLIFDPVIFTIKKRINISLGIFAGIRLFDSNNSTLITTWVDPSPEPWGNNDPIIEEEKISTTQDVIYGAKASISYDISITKKVIISPRYTINYIQTAIVRNSFEEVKSYRNCFDLGIKYKI